MKVLFLNPGKESERQPPLGLLHLAAFLRKHSIPVQIVDFAVTGFSEDAAKRIIKESNAEIVGIQTLTDVTISRAIALSKIAHDLGKFVVWGGAHASIISELSLKNPFVDAIAIGEGEFTLLELVNVLEKKKRLNGIKGLWFKKGKKIVRNKPRELIKSLDEMPLPAWDLINIKDYVFDFLGRNAISIITSRGCPYRCIYCHNRVVFGRSWRGRSVKNIMKEIAFIKKLAPEVNAISFWDDLFTASRKRVFEFCSAFHEKYPNDIWAALVRANQVDEELLSSMKKAGCENIYMGIESGSPRMLGVLKKDITLEQARNAVKIAKQLKMITAVSFIMGAPSETREDIEMSIALAKEISPTVCSFYFFKPYPGSEGYELARKVGFKDPKTLEEWGQVGVYSYITPGISTLSESELFEYRKKIFIALKPNEVKNFLFETLPKTKKKLKYLADYAKANYSIITQSNYSKRLLNKIFKK